MIYSTLYGAGVDGRSWSRQPDSSESTRASNLYFAASGIDTFGGSNHYTAFLVQVLIPQILYPQYPHFPLSYVRSGYINLKYSVLRESGVDGYGWSGIGRPDMLTYDLYISASTVNPSNEYNDRYAAFPVRCQDTPYSLLHYPMCGAG